MGFSKQRRYCIALGLVLAGTGLSAQVASPAPGAGSALILIVGDSLSAEYGLRRGSGWVALLEQRLQQDKRSVKVVNASISGDTTSGGRARLPVLLNQHRPSIVVIELGGNDALRGLPLQMTRDNLQAMASAAQGAGAKVLMLGMQMPPNYGQDYARQFEASFATVAKSTKISLVPFMLKGIADRPDALRLFQNDRIHPTEEAQPMILANVWPALGKLLP